MTYLAVTTEKEIQVQLNGFNASFFVVCDHIKFTYQLTCKVGGEFKNKNKDIFDEYFTDEESAINRLIERLKEYEPVFCF